MDADLRKKNCKFDNIKHSHVSIKRGNALSRPSALVDLLMAHLATGVVGVSSLEDE